MIARFACLSLACALVLSAAPAAAQDDAAEARRHFDAGVQKYEAGQYLEALDEFRDAYRIRPHPAVLVNIANCYMELDRPVDAAASFERYLRESTDIAPEQRAEVERALGQARAAISTIDVAGPPGITVFVDGDAIGRTPLRRPAEVNPGPHVIELRFTDGSVRQQRISLERGQSTTVDAAAGAAPEPVAPPGPVGPSEGAGGLPGPVPSGASGGPTPAPIGPAPADGGGGLEIPLGTWIAGGAAVVALALGIGFGASALSQQSDFEDIARDIQSRPPSDPDIPDLQAEGRSVADAQAANALVADLMFVTAAVAAGIAVVLLVTNDDGTEADPSLTAGIAPISGGAAVALAGHL